MSQWPIYIMYVCVFVWFCVMHDIIQSPDEGTRKTEQVLNRKNEPTIFTFCTL